MLHLLPHLLMRKWGVKTVVPSNIFPVVGEFGFLAGARHPVAQSLRAAGHGVPVLPFFPVGCEEM
jgi:hypothetical protein